MSAGVSQTTRQVETPAAAAPRLPQLPQHVAIVAFEGPDRYASIGGLATRVSALARALGRAGRSVELFFVGDPALRPVEAWAPGVTLRRWCGWISAQHPRNAYDGEAEKIADCENSLPNYLTDFVVAPAAANGERVLITDPNQIKDPLSGVIIALAEEVKRLRLRVDVLDGQLELTTRELDQVRSFSVEDEERDLYRTEQSGSGLVSMGEGI